MPFNKDDYSSKLDSYQSAISLIREERSDGKKILLDQRNSWRNNILAVSFAVAAAFMAAGPNIAFYSAHRKILFWTSTLIFLFVGLFIMIYVKNKLDDDSNEFSSIMMEQEYYLLIVRNLYRQALAAKSEVDENEVRTYIIEFQRKSKDEAQKMKENSKKIQIVDDFWTVLLVYAFYFLGFSFVPLHKGRLDWYVLFGVLVTAGCVVYFYKTYQKAKTANKKYMKWKEELDALTHV